MPVDTPDKDRHDSDRGSDDRPTDDRNDSDGGDHGGDSGERSISPEHDALLLDAMLGTLASYLRMCGYDTVYALDEGIEDDESLRRLAADDARRLITRDRDLAARTPGAVLLTERDVVDQLRELRDAGFRLTLEDQPSRCGACNGPLERVEAETERPEDAPDEGPVWCCTECGQCFWMGSHWDDVAETLAAL